MIHLLVLYTLIEAIVCFFIKDKLKGRIYIWPLLFAAGSAAFGAYRASQQREKAKKLRPSSFVPGSLSEALSSARVDSNATSPGYLRGSEKIQQSTASNVDLAKRIGGNSSQIQQSVANADARQKDAIKDLEVYDASYRDGKKQDLRGLLLQKASFEKVNNDNYNAAVSALKGAATQNENNAISTLMEGAASSVGDGSNRAARLQDLQNQGKTLSKGQQGYLRRFNIKRGYSNEARGLERFNQAGLSTSQYPEYDYVGANGPFNF